MFLPLLRRGAVLLLILGGACMSPYVTAGNPKPVGRALGLATLGDEEPAIDGGACDFDDALGTILRGDGVSAMWIKVGGRLVAMTSQTVAAGGKRWHQVFSSPEASLMLDVRVTAVGAEDTIAMRGVATITVGAKTNAFKITGGCSF